MRSERTEPADRRLAPPAGIVLLGLLVAALACAQQRSPPGVAPDGRAPALREVTPADGSVVPGFDGSLRLRFDEPITAPSGYEREIFFSPADRIRVSYGFSEIRVRPEEGWREEAVYVIRFPDGISDIPPLNNRREEPIEVTFSTGPAIAETVVRGVVRDRVSGETVQEARVLFLSGPAEKAVPYTAVSDTSGRFELAALPPGAYRAFGFEDLNANLELERRIEPYDSASFRLEGASETASLELRLTVPDTTPPELLQVRARDSLTLALEFDDPLDPEQELRVDQVTVRDASGRERSAARILFGEATADDREAGPVEEPSADTVPEGEMPAPADSLPQPGAVPPADTVPARQAEEPPAPRPGAVVSGDTTRLPSPVLRVRMARPLEPGEYTVAARDVRNLRELVGGGEVRFDYTRPEAPADTMPGAPSDSTPEPGRDTGATR